MAPTGSYTWRIKFLFVVVMQVIVSNTVAARPFAGILNPQHGRALLQTHGSLLVEYVGSTGDTSLQFTDVPINSGVKQYIFPLAFAIDADSQGNTANGVFSPYWSSSLTPQAAQSFVQANSNVLLVASLGGATQYVSSTNPSRSVDWYDPADSNAWITNAVSSISSLASQYSLSGIDIDYENFPQGSASFTACIGGLITQLKSANSNFVVSIAPFGNTRSIYADLYANAAVDYVNYQFYADSLNSVADYVNKFNDVATTFDPSKLLASVDVSGRGLAGSDVIAAAQQLTSVAGIMIWDADHDKQNGFAMEMSAAAFLTS